MKLFIIFLALISFTLGAYSPTLIIAESPVHAVVDRNGCIGCNTCVSVCPVKAITNVNGKAIINENKCIGCSLCQKNCPVQTISMEKR